MSNRIAPFNAAGDEVHLRNSVLASETGFQNDLDVSPPYDWNWAVAIRDGDTGAWKRLDSTFDTFREADDRFVTVSKQQFPDLDVGALMMGKPDNGANGRRPELPV